jgi:pimeloyl-ACP methyl ester carboxylesterase
MKRPLQIIKWVAYILAGLFLLISISLLVYRNRLRNATKIETANGISSLEEISLGGVKQWIFIRGTDQENPVLIFLHGGPGAPIPGISSARNLDAELIKHFTVVHWDQRGTGKSHNRDIPINSMTFDRLVEDCNELIDYLRNRFNTQKVFIVGHSAGSIVGIKTAHKYPEKIYAYVGIGQIVNDFEQQKISYNFVVEEAEKSGDVKTQNAIEAIGPPPYDSLEEVNEKDEYIFQYGGVIHESSVKQIGTLQLMFLTSPEYTLLEGIRTFMMRGYEFTMAAMWQAVKNINLEEEIQSIEVPIYFFEGKYDMATARVPVEDFYDTLDAEKGKRLFIFENSAHFPMIEEKEKYQKLLVNVVLQESQEK